jgi:phosphatidylserine decarboxylase
LSKILGFITYEALLGQKLCGHRGFLKQCGIDLQECLEQAAFYDSPKKIFERQIRYWEKRPMPEDSCAIVSPADARVLVGSLSDTRLLFIKEKFFEFEQLLGCDHPQWLHEFACGDFAIFRLTPDKYHYNHTPVAGKVVDFYEIAGLYHSCNPGAVVTAVTPYSKNKRVVTIIDTDVPEGSSVGLVAMIEVVALMIGDIVQCYSDERYDDPRDIVPGMFVKKGVPKSLYRPGSSTDILIFQKNRIHFAEDILRNRLHGEAQSRFTLGFGVNLVETDVKVRSLIGASISE